MRCRRWWRVGIRSNIALHGFGVAQAIWRIRIRGELYNVAVWCANIRLVIHFGLGIILHLLNVFFVLHRTDPIRLFNRIGVGIVNPVIVSMNIPHVILLERLKIDAPWLALDS